tara:strand:- start:2228 stop:3082 length:855 start_codon:yes stop_codon:yes gene_type:complete
MGDKNQNQSLGAYKLVGDQEMMQPSKISGGAAKYIKEAYGADKIGDPETAAEKAEKKAADDSRLRDKADNVGNFRYEQSVREGGARDSREGLIGGTASNMATKVSGAVKDLDKINSNLSTRSQSDIIGKATKISGFNTDKLHNQYTSRGGGSYDHMKERASLTSYGKRDGGFMSKKEMQATGGSGKSLNEELNAEKSEFKKSNQFYDALKTGASQYTSEGKHKTMKQQTGLKPSSGTFGIGGANKIHSSKGYGINKILGDLDNSGNLSDYEAKRQSAIEKNMKK